MSFSFSIASKSQSNRPKRPALTFSDSDNPPPSTNGAAAAAAPARSYVREFDPAEPLKFIPPIPNAWEPTKKLKNLPNLTSLTQSHGADSSLQFELDPGLNRDTSDNSMGYGLNLRQVTAENGGSAEHDRREPISDLELRNPRVGLEKFPEDTGEEEFADVPVEGFGAALLAGYGWKEGMGIGRNVKKDVDFCEVKKKVGRGGIGFNGELSEKPIESYVEAADNGTNGNVGRRKRADDKAKVSVYVGKEVRIVSGREIGMKGKVAEVRRGGDILVLRLARTGEKMKVQVQDVAEVGSVEEDKCLRRLKESKSRVETVDVRKGDGNSSRNTGGKEIKMSSAEKVDWLRNHIRVRIISKELKGGRLFLKKGVVVDIIQPGICDISMDGNRELVQGVEQEFLETALPKRGGPVLVLFGRYKGVHGSLVERNSEKQTGLVQDADTHEMLNVRLEQIAEYTGDLYEIGY